MYLYRDAIGGRERESPATVRTKRWKQTKNNSLEFTAIERFKQAKFPFVRSPLGLTEKKKNKNSCERS